MSESIDDYIDVAVRLRICLDKAWTRLQSLPALELASLTTRTKSNLMHDFWTEAVEAEFAGDDFAQFVESRGLKHLVTEFARIRFKKVNRRLLVANSRTQQAASWIQLPIPGVTKVLSLTFGYRPDSLWIKIATAGLVLQVCDGVPWFLEVGPLDADQNAEAEETVIHAGAGQLRVKRHILEIRQAELREAQNNNDEVEGGSRSQA